MVYIILGSIAWYLIGIFSFIYWWTKDNDFTINDLPKMFVMGIYGPFAIIIGYFIHSDSNKVIFKKQSNRDN